ncbi:hypothetical protein TVAG_406850 [Trichomonas vaginalis G3]|uniref:Uncharacterized protein n=1 Tax=Trichomonas vaginalis (strain ATCC PRA-98 / G3) TaxID=412133 RepID=A2FID5_TRIV3|nr:hypothetical protein TVAGG3_0200320 [Trichomonas vaginalis G3]EAX95337.1 hypothetical protein TVAG_406850 [Trichomonas vaginalis G3]KAI5550562.1 hypothetical protein TVAGG3_0200320 [Trichomonas vaginalis G3]|eukprot:XP_001308267.1 hypothetical protein [Trichomonas vaginalis G3]
MSDCQRFMESMTDLPMKKFDDEKNYGEYMIEFISSMFKNCFVLHTNFYNEKLFCFIDQMKEEKENNKRLWLEMWEKLKNDNTSPYFVNLP